MQNLRKSYISKFSDTSQKIQSQNLLGPRERTPNLDLIFNIPIWKILDKNLFYWRQWEYSYVNYG